MQNYYCDHRNFDSVNQRLEIEKQSWFLTENKELSLSKRLKRDITDRLIYLASNIL